MAVVDRQVHEEVVRTLRRLVILTDPEFHERTAKALRQPPDAWHPTTAAELRDKLLAK